MGWKSSSVAAIGFVALVFPAAGQEFQANRAQLSELYSGKAYSPYAQRTFPERPLWGDSHLHTSLSMDAGGFGNRVGLRDAYRLARGEEIIASSGQPVRLSRPLDWLAITDHSDGMGFIIDILAASPLVTKYEQGARWSKGILAGGQEAVLCHINTFVACSIKTVYPGMRLQYQVDPRAGDKPVALNLTVIE